MKWGISMFRKNAGFSMLEVVIAMGLLGAISMMMMRLTDNMNKSVATLETRMEEMDLINLIRLNMISKESCSRTFAKHCSDRTIGIQGPCESAGKTWDDGVTLPVHGSGVEVNTVYNHLGIPVINKNQVINNSLKIISITLESEPESMAGVPAAGGLGAATMNVTYQRLKKVNGAEVITKKIAIMLKTNAPLPAPIDSCLSASDAEILPKDRTYLLTNNYSSASCDPAGTSGCVSYTASCQNGDQALAGDCLLVTSKNAEKVSGDFVLSIPGSTNCTGCPDDAANCDAKCIDNEYTGYECKYYDGSQGSTAGARILCLDRSF